MPIYPSPPKTDLEAREREWLNSQVGANGLVVDFDTKGRTSLFYLSQADESLVNLLYRLPIEKIGLGGSWEIPVQMVQAEPTLMVNTSDYFSNVTLQDLRKNDKGQNIAGLFFLGGAKTEGLVAITLDESRPRKA